MRICEIREIIRNSDGSIKEARLIGYGVFNDNWEMVAGIFGTLEEAEAWVEAYEANRLKEQAMANGDPEDLALEVVEKLGANREPEADPPGLDLK